MLITSLFVAAAAFPTPADTATRLPLKICYNVAVEVTPLYSGPDGSVSFTRLPMCVDFRDYFDVEAGFAACNLGSTSSHSCFYPPKSQSGYVKVKTSRFEFEARTRGGDLNFKNGFGFTAPHDGGLDFSAWYYLDTNWDYRISQILAAHKPDLDVRLESLMLPAVQFNNHYGMALGTTVHWADAAPPFAVAHSRNGMNTVNAIGYDANNAEYDVRIWVEQGEVEFAGHR